MTMLDKESDVSKAVFAAQFDLMVQNWLAEHWNHWFGQIAAALAQTGTHTAGEDGDLTICDGCIHWEASL